MGGDAGPDGTRDALLGAVPLERRHGALGDLLPGGGSSVYNMNSLTPDGELTLALVHLGYASSPRPSRLTRAPAKGTLDDMSKLETLGNDVEEALEHINVPSYVLDEHGIIRWVNPAAERLVGDVRGKQLTSVVAPEEKSRAQDEFAKKVFGTQ